jgi:hypothetical protein
MWEDKDKDGETKSSFSFNGTGPKTFIMFMMTMMMNKVINKSSKEDQQLVIVSITVSTQNGHRL